MAAAPAFSITYWGVTGSFAAPLKPVEVSGKLQNALLHLARHDRLTELADVARDPARLQLFLEQNLPFALRSTYGGNTTCVEIQTPDELFILDCGSGFRELGLELERRWNAPDFSGKRQAHVIVTHPHMDHTFGTPLFDPYMDSRNHFTLYASPSVLNSLDAVLSPASPLSSTYFPLTFDVLKAIRNRVTLEEAMKLTVGATTISTMKLRHPGGCLGFRFDCGGRSFVFCTDHEHIEAPDQAVAHFARGADVLYLDGQYRAAEYEGKVGVMGETPLPRRGWGHSSVEACVATAVAARVRNLHIGHREPKRDDADLARLEAYLQQCLAEALHREGAGAPLCAACLPWEGMKVALA
jgi:phosphoribosyl 1,2-cyclic phosphodiesterase